VIGPNADEVEPLGSANALATGFEVAIVLIGTHALIGDREGSVRLRAGRAEALTWTLSLVVAGATTLGLLSAIGAGSSVLPRSL
jgi:hypothetical protein